MLKKILIICIASFMMPVAANSQTQNLDKFEDQIESFRRFDARNQLPENPILFVGSSSIVFWETAKSFPDLPITNRGFGGASLPEVIHYYDDVIKNHNPSMMIVYCDIDVENGKSPDFSVNAFKELINKVEADFDEIPILLMSMKPTLIDDDLGADVRKNKMITNQKLIEYTRSKSNLHYVDITSPMLDQDGKLREDIFIDDGMHLNPLGYTLWDPIMTAAIEKVRK
jgi:lysophospholipase L1-like esterase